MGTNRIPLVAIKKFVLAFISTGSLQSDEGVDAPRMLQSLFRVSGMVDGRQRTKLAALFLLNITQEAARKTRALKCSVSLRRGRK
jgi:hypothetical protein